MEIESDIIRFVRANPDWQQATFAFSHKNQYAVVGFLVWFHDVEHGNGDHLFAPGLFGNGWSRLQFVEIWKQLGAQLAAGLVQTPFDGGHADLQEGGDLAHAQLLEIVEKDGIPVGR